MKISEARTAPTNLRRNWSGQIIKWLPALVFAVLAVRSIIAMSGIPAFRHDWQWPFLGEQLTQLPRLDISLIHPMSVSPNPYVGIIPAHAVLAVAATLMPSKLVLILYLVGVFALSFLGATRLTLAVFPEAGKFALLAGMIYAGNPVAFNKLVAGHYYYLGAFALFPWGVKALLLCRNRYRDGLLPGILFGLTNIQLQFIALSALAIVTSILLLRRWRSGTISLAVLLTTTLPQILAPIFMHNESVLAMQQTNSHWLDNNSALLIDALRGIGYAPHYYESVASRLELQSLWLLPAISASALLIRSRRKQVVTLLVVSLLFCIIISGTRGPASELVGRIFEFGPTSLFRELYHLAVVPSLVWAILVPIVVRKVFERSRAVGMVLAIACSIEALPLIANSYTTLLPQFDYGTMQLAVLSALPDDAGRVVWLPARQPLGPGSAVGGVDPFGLPTHRHDSLFEFWPDNLFSAALNRVEDDSGLSSESFAALGVKYIVLRHGFVSRRREGLEPRLRPLVTAGEGNVLKPLATPFRHVFSVSGADVYANPLYQGDRRIVQARCSNTWTPDALADDDAECWGGSTIRAKAVLVARSDDPREHWQPVANWSDAFAWIRYPDAGFISLSKEELVLRPPARSSDDGLFVSLACRVKSRVSLRVGPVRHLIPCETRPKWVQTGIRARDGDVSILAAPAGTWLRKAIYSALPPGRQSISKTASKVLVTSYAASDQWQAWTDGTLMRPVVLQGGRQAWLSHGRTADIIDLRYGNLIRACLVFSALAWIASLAGYRFCINPGPVAL